MTGNNLTSVFLCYNLCQTDMRRFTSIFIIVNLLLCYTGLYHGALASLKPAPGKISSGCHSMSHSGKETNSGYINRTINKSAGSIHSCCYDSLPNAPVDQYLAFGEDLVYEITIANLNRNAYHLKTALNCSPREHGPPDLQVSNSVFLL